jgi:exopolysaccharide production protein ExoZ
MMNMSNDPTQSTVLAKEPRGEAVIGADAVHPPRLSGVEASRGVAASLVVFYHAARHLDKGGSESFLNAIFQFGHAGVDFFFVISGFVIFFVHLSDAGDPSRLGRYANRRFTRLIPIYWFALAVRIAFAAVGRHGAPSWIDIAWSGMLVPSDTDMVLGVAWTLRYEVVFYALFALLIAHRRAGLTFMGVWLLASALTLVAIKRPDWLASQFASAWCLEFGFGMFAAYAVRRRVVSAPGLLLSIGVTLFASAALLEDIGSLDGYAESARLAYGIPSALILAGVAERDRRGSARVPAFALTVGGASYSIYLFHPLIIGVVWQAMLFVGADRWAPPLALFVCLVAMAIGGGVAVSRWVEYPIIQFLRRSTGGI